MVGATYSVSKHVLDRVLNIILTPKKFVNFLNLENSINCFECFETSL